MTRNQNKVEMKGISNMAKAKQPRAGANLTPASSSSELLTKEQVATYLQTSRRYVERLIKAGRLRAHKLSSGCVRVRRGAVEALLEGCASMYREVCAKHREGSEVSQ